MKKPVYAICTDADVQASEKAGKMSSDIRNRLVRGTIEQYGFHCLKPSFQPVSNSVRVRRNVIKYTCLSDSDTGHVSIPTIIFPVDQLRDFNTIKTYDDLYTLFNTTHIQWYIITE